MPLSIRTARPEDEVSIVDLWRRCGLVVPHNDPLRDIARNREVEHAWLLVGESDGAIIATCMVGYDGHRGAINYLAVDPDHQRKEYARELMAEAEARLTRVGCPKINLCVRTTNTGVVAFYERIGYTDNACLSLGKRLIRDAEPSTEG